MAASASSTEVASPWGAAPSSRAAPWQPAPAARRWHRHGALRHLPEQPHGSPRQQHGGGIAAAEMIADQREFSPIAPVPAVPDDLILFQALGNGGAQTHLGRFHRRVAAAIR